MILLVGGEKGGTGKTTLATNLAALRGGAGRDVLLLDTDAQGSASYWVDVRADSGIDPAISCVQRFGKGLTGAIQDLADRYEDIVIDAGGRDSVELRGALVIAEQVLMPLQASQFDAWTMARMADLVAQARGFNPDMQVRVALNRAHANPSVTEVREAKEFLGDFEGIGLCRTIIRDRIAYRRAAAEGRSVLEQQRRDGKAAAEIHLLAEELFQ